MLITVLDYIDRGYLVVSQELRLITSNINNPIFLYIDSNTVSCLHNDRILQYETFEQLVTPLGLIGLHISILTRIYTDDGTNMYKIRKQYIDNFMNKFHIKKITDIGNKLAIEISMDYVSCAALSKLRQQIVSYNHTIKAFDFVIN